MINKKMLEFLVKQAKGEVIDIDTDEFFNNFPRSKSVYDDLYSLSRFGYITVLAPDDGPIDYIGVNQTAHDYFK